MRAITAGVRAISRSRPTPAEQLRVVTAQLRISESALARLLSVSGSQSDFILASADGSTTVKVGLAIASVPDSEISLGKRGVILNWSRSTLSKGGARVPLTRMELRLLVAMLEQAPGTASYEHLVSRMWPTERVRDGVSALQVWVCGLRRRFAAMGVQNAIRTVRGSGYALSL